MTTRLWWPLAVALALGQPAPAPAADWDATRAEAEGETVYFNAWGGNSRINAYIAWVGEQVRACCGVELVHVKLTDTAEAVTRVLAEKAAGRTDGGSVDLIWINGENFAAMKREQLLFGPFATDLPRFALVDVAGKPTTVVDFTVPTEGYESPWGMAQFVMLYDEAEVAEPPQTTAEILAWAKAHPGRFTLPAPPDFVGSTFLKHAALELALEPELLRQAPDGLSETQIKATLAPLWSWLDDLQPAMWRSGEGFPASGPALHRLLADGEVAFSMAFNPAEASGLILDGQLPDTVRTYVLDTGSIGNTHFVAIPFNAAHTAGAMVVADFLLSPEAQARKLDPAVWGDGTVLDIHSLDPSDTERFEAVPRHPATLPPEALEPVLLELHPDWMTRIEADWQRRYGS
jgi:putative thiamine transport system substrate-binding protein